MRKILLVISIGGLFIQSCDNESKKVEPVIRPFPVVAAEMKDLNGFYTYPTDIAGQNTNQVRSKIQGYIKEVYVEDGQKVTAGQILFRIETNVQEQNAQASKAQIGAADATISAAQANLKAAQVEIDKLTPLVEKGIISSILLETAKANYMKAQSQVSQTKANKEVANANYQGVVETIGYYIIKSPINGVVGKINARQGALVSPSDPQPITTISDVSKVYAYFSLTEKQYIDFFEQYPGKDLKEKLGIIPPIDLVLANGSTYSEKGKIETATGQIDPGTGTIQFRVAYANSTGLLSNGSSGEIKIPRSYGNVLVVPEAATFDQQGFTYVFKVINDTARAAVIEVNDRVNNYAIVSKGLEKGDIIIAAGVNTIKPGSAIKPKPANMDSIVNNIKPVF